MKKKTPKIKISTLKYHALQLRTNKQLPYLLCKYITDLKGDESKRYITWLMVMSEHLLRIKGYYTRYPLEEESANNLIKEGRLKLGDIYDNNDK